MAKKMIAADNHVGQLDLYYLLLIIITVYLTYDQLKCFIYLIPLQAMYVQFSP